MLIPDDVLALEQDAAAGDTGRRSKDLQHRVRDRRLPAAGLAGEPRISPSRSQGRHRRPRGRASRGRSRSRRPVSAAPGPLVRELASAAPGLRAPTGDDSTALDHALLSLR